MTSVDGQVFPTSSCRSCGRAIVWAETTGGKSMPVDRDPRPSGNVSLIARPGRAPLAMVVPTGALIEPGRLRVADVDETPVEPLRTSHFRTCPQADRWRR